MQEEPEIIDVSSKGFHTISREGVTQGLPKLYKFSWVHPETGETVFTGQAFGKNNLNFRRAEVTGKGHVQGKDFIFKVHDEEE